MASSNRQKLILTIHKMLDDGKGVIFESHTGDPPSGISYEGAIKIGMSGKVGSRYLFLAVPLDQS